MKHTTALYKSYHEQVLSTLLHFKGHFTLGANSTFNFQVL